MNAAMQTVLNTLKLDNQLAGGIFALDEDTARRVVVDNTNNIMWLTGHLLNARWYLLGLFGDTPELPWESKFRDKLDPSAEYPTMAELKEKWDEVSSALTAKIEAASDADFEKEIDWELPNNDKTIRGGLLFYMFHEGWHMGQIAFARKAMGMDGLVPY